MDTFSALAEPTRREIIELLAKKGQMNATEIYENFSSTPPAISQHLKVLKEAKLVEVEKLSQMRIYKINTQSLHNLEGWARNMNKLWKEKLDKLETVLVSDNRKRKGGGSL